MLSDEALRNASSGMQHAAERIGNAGSELAFQLQHDRQLREEQLARFEQAAELMALAALVNQHAASTHADAVQYGAQQCAPDYRAARKLADLLEARGVLPKLPKPKPDDEVVPW